VQTPAHGAGLDGVLRAVSYKFTGILNGIDTEEWNPATDEHLPAHFMSENLRGKATVKRKLLAEFELPSRAKTPLIGIVSRMVEQKGFQLLLPVLGKLLRAGAQVIILGSGDRAYEEAFEDIAQHHPDSCRVRIGFDNSLAHRIYGGADMILIPSMYEPCGLNQMYALRYGTLPVVRLTGGLADTVIAFDGTNAESANGFGFSAPSSEDLFFATWSGMLNYKDSKLWKTLQRNGMAQDFSWSKSAAQYEEVYRRAMAS
ncbi:MAG TPA: glycosyltransferase, partial [Thermoanaerobaculia bacterium]